eukprot:220753-Pleurochrysis_carterae.AAC.1
MRLLYSSLKSGQGQHAYRGPSSDPKRAHGIRTYPTRAGRVPARAGTGRQQRGVRRRRPPRQCTCRGARRGA